MFSVDPVARVARDEEPYIHLYIYVYIYNRSHKSITLENKSTDLSI